MGEALITRRGGSGGGAYFELLELDRFFLSNAMAYPTGNVSEITSISGCGVGAGWAVVDTTARKHTAHYTSTSYTIYADTTNNSIYVPLGSGSTDAARLVIGYNEPGKTPLF